MPVPATGRPVAVTMRMAGIDIDLDQVQLAMANPALGDQCIGKAAHGRSRPAQDDRFEAVRVVEMGMHGRHAEIVLSMLQGSQALRQVAFMVVIDIGQAGYSVAALTSLPARLF